MNKTYEDYSTNIESLTLAKQQMIEAQFNYDQAFGEYKAGKGDILSLVRAATLLSDARITVSTSTLDFELSKAAIELTAGIENIETMKKITVP
jgi:outer membrane protein TolC